MPHAVGILIAFIIMCAILGFLYWAFQQLIRLVTIAEPFATLVRIALAGIMLAIVIWAIYVIAGAFGFHIPSLGLG